MMGGIIVTYLRVKHVQYIDLWFMMGGIIVTYLRVKYVQYIDLWLMMGDIIVDVVWYSYIFTVTCLSSLRCELASRASRCQLHSTPMIYEL